MNGIRALDSCRARHNSIWQRERESVPLQRRREAQADEARPLDDDPVVDRVQQVGLLLGNVSVLPRLAQRPEPFNGAVGLARSSLWRAR